MAPSSPTNDVIKQCEKRTSQNSTTCLRSHVVERRTFLWFPDAAKCKLKDRNTQKVPLPDGPVSCGLAWVGAPPTGLNYDPLPVDPADMVAKKNVTKPVKSTKDNTQKTDKKEKKEKTDDQGGGTAKALKESKKATKDKGSDDEVKDVTVECSAKKKKAGDLGTSKNARKKPSFQRKKANRTRTEEAPTMETETNSHRGRRVRHVPTNQAQLENYQQFLRETCNVGVQGIIKQFNDFLKAYVPPGATSKAFQSNTDKNRYKDVICLDATRVILRGGKQGETDYIHANYVDHDILSNRFIATQGPLHSTVYEFWRMVVNERSQLIFMLCQTVEMDKEKCHQYWAKDKGCAMTFKDITIKTVDVDKTTDNTNIISTLHVTSPNLEKPLVVKHWHWQNWPDRSVPQSILAPFRMLKVARVSKAPTVIHCSAGVGRTGAVIGIECALQHILSSKPCNMTQVVQELRMKRMHCVQTDLQLVYMYRCLFAYAEACGVMRNQADLDARAKQFVKEYDTLINDRLKSQPVKASPAGNVGAQPVAGPQPAAPTPMGPQPKDVHAPPAMGTPSKPGSNEYIPGTPQHTGEGSPNGPSPANSPAPPIGAPAPAAKMSAENMAPKSDYYC
uniref:Protein-tyrosine phosphatase n=1 Tax=Panagrellus redivivus TaxID=6233 RepID=A0A7E4VZE5_PANRE